MSERLRVNKTYKLAIGGAFPRSESGRSYPVHAPDGRLLAHAARASRKDLRDAVVAARGAQPGWAARHAANRGQIVYRAAEVLEQRAAELATEAAEAEGVSPTAATAQITAAVDRLVWYAGWADKVAQVVGSANPVAGPYFDFTIPEPVGVIAIAAPDDGSVLGLVSVLAPVIVTGNTAVVVAAERAPLAALTFAEILATSDVPGGVVNVLSGLAGELLPVAAAHLDVDGLDLAGAPEELLTELEAAAAGNVKRVLRRGDVDWTADPGTARLEAFLELKTVWHTVGT